MSTLTLQRLAQQNVDQADQMLEEWRQALNRGDFTQSQASPVVDAILELRTASSLIAASPGKTPRRRKQKVNE